MIFNKNKYGVGRILTFCVLFFGSISAQAQNFYNYYEYQEYSTASNPRLIGDNPNQLCNDLINQNQRPQYEANGYTVTITGVEQIGIKLWDCNGEAEASHSPGVIIHLGGPINGLCQKHGVDQSSRPIPISILNAPNNDEFGCNCRSPAHFFDRSIQWCVADLPNKDAGCGGKENSTDNPCNVATGNKYRNETDITSGALSFTRSYNSDNLFNFGLGRGWRTNFQKSLSVNRSPSLKVVSGTGRGENWRKLSGVWVGDADSDYILTENASGYQITNADASVDNFGTNGRIISSIDANGNQTMYQYDQSSNLLSVSNHYGHSISFEYSRGTLISATDSLGAVYRYEYDDIGNLVAVVFPDLTMSDDSDNPRKIYHYENTDFPNHLTGITNERGERYGNFAYDQDGKAILSELGTTSNTVGQEKMELDYQGAN